MDRRLTPANARVAVRALQGQVPAERFVDPVPRMIRAEVVDLLDAPDGSRDRQLILGTPVDLIEDRNGWAFVQAPDGYVGYLPSDALGMTAPVSHRVATFATHAYKDEDIKSPVRAALPFGARVQVLDERRRFFETPQGFVPKTHLRPLDRPFSDPATLAQLHFGVPYLWGGDTTRGIDCSGLIAASLRACDIDCPGDSDLQCDQLGAFISSADQRGDLVFWKGHVGMLVDESTLIHANAHHMATQYEPLERAILRITAQDGGMPVAYKRL